MCIYRLFTIVTCMLHAYYIMFVIYCICMCCSHVSLFLCISTCVLCVFVCLC